MEFLAEYMLFIDKFWFILAISVVISSLFIIASDDGKLISYRKKVDKSSNSLSIALAVVINMIAVCGMVKIFFNPAELTHVFVASLLIMNFLGGNKPIDTNAIAEFQKCLK